MSTGLATILELLRESGDLGDGGGEVVDLFGETDAAPRPLAPQGKRGPGRPPGARNRTTREMALWLKSRGPAPLVAMQDLLTWDWRDLSTELQDWCDARAKRSGESYSANGGSWTEKQIMINPLDVLRLQMAVSERLAEYTDQKQPRALEVSAPMDRRATVIIGDLSDAGGSGGGISLPVPDEKMLSEQGFIDGALAQSDDAQSDDDDKPLDDNEKPS